MEMMIQELGVVGVLAAALIFLIKYLTGDLKQEIIDLKNIIVKLIDKINNLKETVDKRWKE
jgi:hypothetical protein